LEILDRECETQIVNRQSTVDKSLVAAAHKEINKNPIERQSQGVERYNYSIHGTKCQFWEIVQLEMRDESRLFSVVQSNFVERREKTKVIW
jgi:hypothetical protein